MPNDHYGALDPVQQLGGRREACGVAGLGIVQRQVGRDHRVPAGAQLARHLVPARTVVPGAVQQAEGCHRSNARSAAARRHQRKRRDFGPG